ncbi:glycosyltransferase family 2 protein [Riemerella anatipestifer]
MPAYNAGKYINTSLQCIYNQKYKNWETIIIDDGSTDNTKDVVNNWIEKDSRFKYFYQNNSGVSIARNTGIHNAKGRYIVFVDADDETTDDFIIDFIDNIELEDTLLIQDINRFMPHKTVMNYLSLKHEKIELKKASYNSRVFVGYAVNKLYNLSILQKYNIKFDESLKMREDEAFFFEYLKYMKYLKLINKANYNYITRSESASEKIYHFKDYLKVIGNFSNFINSGIIIKDKNNMDLCINYTIVFNNLMKSLSIITPKERLNILKENHNKFLFSFIKFKIKRFNFIMFLYRIRLYSPFNYFWYKNF